MDIKSNRAKYELLMMVLALTVAIMSIVQIIVILPEEIDIFIKNVISIVYYIFVFDYFIRLAFSVDKWKFIKGNIVELICIIPFTKIFILLRVVSVLRITEALKIIRTLKATIFINNGAKKFKSIVGANNFIYVAIITIILIFSSAGFIAIFEKIKFKDALWWSFVTTTSVGYGDIAPNSDMGRIVAVILMLVGVLFMGVLTGAISSYFLKRDIDFKNNKNKRREVIEYVKGRLDNFDDLSDDELKDIVNILHSINRSEKKG